MTFRPSAWVAASAVTVVTVLSLNALLIAEVKAYRRAEGRPSIDATLPGSLEQPAYTAYLLFSPAQCSSHYLNQIKAWRATFEEFHGGRIWVQPVAVYTSRAELGRLWDVLGFKLAVHVNPEGSILTQLGLSAVPAKVVVDAAGRVVYREAFPELYEEGRLDDVLRQLGRGAHPSDDPIVDLRHRQ